MKDNGDSIPLKGIRINDTQFTGAIRTGMMLRLVTDPRRAEDKKERESYPDAQDLFEMRGDVQRTFTGAKAKNVDPFQRYLNRIEVEGEDGAVPPITLWTKEQLSTNDEGTILYIPYGCVLTSIDGDSQTAARFEGVRANRALADSMAKVVVYHGKPLAFAKQCFHDLNMLSVKVDSNWAATLDQRNPATSIARYLEENLSWLKGKVNQRTKSLKGTPHLLRFIDLRIFVGCISNGAQALGAGSKPVPIEPAEKVLKVQTTAKYFLDKLYARFPDAMTDRQRYLLLNPTIFCALGALVTDCVEQEDKRREYMIDLMIDVLAEVQWNTSSNWLKVAGRETKKGVAFGGPKQSGYNVLAALRTKERNPSWYIVRGQKVPAELEQPAQIQPELTPVPATSE